MLSRNLRSAHLRAIETTTSVDLCGSPELESKNLNGADNCRDTSSEVLDDGLGGRVPKKGSEEEEQQWHSERNYQK